MELWKGLIMSEVRNCYLVDRTAGTFVSVLKIIDLHNNGVLTQLGIPTFTTGTNGAVIVDESYSLWKFITPNDYSVASGATVADVFANLRAASVATPVRAWETFASWFGSSGASKMNSFIVQDGATTITDANGNSYTGSQQLCTGTVTNFAEFLDWVQSWCGAEFLAANASAVYESEKLITWSFAVTVMGYAAALTFQFKL